MCHNSIPTNDLRRHRHLAQSDICPRCLNSCEDGIHYFCECPQALQIWKSFGFGSNANRWNLDVVKWLKDHLQKNNAQSPPQLLFACILWWIWWARNVEVLEDEKWPCMCVICMIKIMEHACTMAFKFDGTSSSREGR